MAYLAQQAQVGDIYRWCAPPPSPKPYLAATAPPSPSRRPLLLHRPSSPLPPRRRRRPYLDLPPAHGGGAARVRRHPQLDPWHDGRGATGDDLFSLPSVRPPLPSSNTTTSSSSPPVWRAGTGMVGTLGCHRTVLPTRPEKLPLRSCCAPRSACSTTWHDTSCRVVPVSCRDERSIWSYIYTLYGHIVSFFLFKVSPVVASLACKRCISCSTKIQTVPSSLLSTIDR
jgi:hypothetical protein